MTVIIKSSNSLLAALIAQLNLGSLRRLRYITINYTQLTMDIIKLLYKEGIIRLYIFKDNKLLVYFKYFKGCHLFKFKIISKPSKRIYWSLHKLSLKYIKRIFLVFILFQRLLVY